MSALAEFFDRYDCWDAPTVLVGDVAEQWPKLVVRFRGKTVVLQFCGVAAGGEDEHLSIDVHAFVAEATGRTGVFGMEHGVRYEGFSEGAPGLSHGWPAVAGVSLLIGRQA